MRFPIEIFVVVCLVVGILPNVTIGPLLNVAVAAVLGPGAPQFDLAVWHGFTLPFLMSVLAMVGGVILYALLRSYGFESFSLKRRVKADRLTGDPWALPPDTSWA